MTFNVNFEPGSKIFDNFVLNEQFEPAGLYPHTPSAMDTLTTMSVAAFILGIFWLWGRVEKASDERKLALHQHMPIPSECTYSSDQASVIVCTLDTLLARCLHTWLANNPSGSPP